MAILDDIGIFGRYIAIYQFLGSIVRYFGILKQCQASDGISQADLTHTIIGPLNHFK